jgi:hypothetical protein
VPKIPTMTATDNDKKAIPPVSSFSKEIGLQPFLFHGLDLSKRVSGGSGGGQAIGDCPFCAKVDKYYVNTESGQWDCKSCGLSGNVYGFLSKLWELGSNKSPHDDSELINNRGFLSVEPLIAWGVRKSVITSEWLVPGYNIDGKLIQLYRYFNNNGHMELRPTKGLSHAIHGVPLYDKKDSVVMLSEGAWDGMILWETLKEAKIKGVSVLAVPSANVFREQWLSLFSGKIVYLMYDSDKPKTLDNGVVKKPVGYEAMKKLTGIMMTSNNPPKEVRYLKWGENGYDANKPSGYDVRDFLRGL